MTKTLQALAVAGALAAPLLSGGAASAADHLDPPARTDPAVNAANADRAADIADVYAWHGSSSVVAVLSFAGPNDPVAGQSGIHAALDDDLVGAALTPCSMTTQVNGLPECVGQEVAAGVKVADLVLPDTLQINPAVAAGYPNGRRLQDPVIDVTLSVILLKLGASCGAGTCSPLTLVNPPLNPPANDVAFGTEFPYLAPAHAP